MLVVAYLFLLPLAVSGNVCTSSRPVWSTENGNILINGQVFHLKGTNWFGFESESHAPHGLWSKSIDHIVNRMAQLKINALRLPFSVFLVLNNPSDTNVDCGANGHAVCSKNAVDLMEHLIDKLGQKGILVMLDQHRLHGGPFQSIDTWITELWYDNTYSEARVLESWDILMKRFGSKWNVMALDLKNEPRGRASWGKNSANDWNKAAERIIKHIAKRHPQYKGLFFVEGVAENADTTTPNSYAHFWGGNLEGVHRHPISTGNPALDKRVVYAPHTYGPDVHNQEYFKTGDFPRNMPKIWDLHFGFVEKLTGRPVVTGEWGGKYGSGPTGQKDVQWEDAFADYLIERCMADNFYWSLNPNSADTGGLLNDDWTTFNEAKKRLIARVQPNPSKLTKSGAKYCYQPGSPANSKCGNGQVVAPPSTGGGQHGSGPLDPPKLGGSNGDQGNTGGSDGSLRVFSVVDNSWKSGGVDVKQIKVVLTNTHPAKAICGVRVKISPSSVKIDNSWVLEWVDKSKKIFKYPSWLHLAPNGGKHDGGGIVYQGSNLNFEVLAVDFC